MQAKEQSSTRYALICYEDLDYPMTRRAVVASPVASLTRMLKKLLSSCVHPMEESEGTPRRMTIVKTQKVIESNVIERVRAMAEDPYIRILRTITGFSDVEIDFMEAGLARTYTGPLGSMRRRIKDQYFAVKREMKRLRVQKQYPESLRSEHESRPLNMPE